MILYLLVVLSMDCLIGPPMTELNCTMSGDSGHQLKTECCKNSFSNFAERVLSEIFWCISQKFVNGVVKEKIAIIAIQSWRKII
jgi:hypothetical protein